MPCCSRAQVSPICPHIYPSESIKMQTAPLTDHWNTAYRARERDSMTWAQTDDAMAQHMDQMAVYLSPDCACIDIGAGTSQLAAQWVARGVGHVAVLDVSDAALHFQRSTLPPNCDVIHASVLNWTPTRSYDLWHDRAVFHFLTDPDDQSTYVAQMVAALASGGVAVISTFDTDGPDRCSNLPVQRYSSDQLAKVVKHLSQGELVAISAHQTQHITPNARTQAFQTTLFQKAAE